jgi:M6 family metalloprotease-like protein
LVGLFFILGFAWSLAAAPIDVPKIVHLLPDLSEFRTVDKAITTRLSMASAAAVGQAGYLGVYVTPDSRGKLVLAEVAPQSPAAKAGLQAGDVLVRLGDQPVENSDRFRELLQARAPGDKVVLAIIRKDKPLELTATLDALSRPMKVNDERASLGVRIGEPRDEDGVPIGRITPGSPADKAGLKSGEILLRIDGHALSSSFNLADALAEKKPGDTVTVTVRRDGKDVELRVDLVADQGPGGRRGGGWDNRALSYFRKDVYRLAVIAVEYPDVKHNPKITQKEWEEALFSRKAYVSKNNATGQPVYGSLNDYYQEQSYGALRVEGKMFNWVEVGKKRADYGQNTNNRASLLVEALDKLLDRDGKDALKEFDGLFFLYAGDRVRTNRGGLYWPHRASVSHQGKRWAYFICNEGGSRMSNISVACHEFGHMLGLPDLYARPENPGSEGLGVWCAMSNQIGNGRPQHFCAWSKEKLGWVKPAVIDPTVKQKLILAPIEDSARECVKVLIKADGSEYLLLENRRKKGFDQGLPAEGLLIWRVVQNRPILEESHGVEGPAGPRVFLNAVPYPSTANNAFTPYTTPSSRSQLGGGLPVHITNIRRLADGRITFYVGYEYL